VPAVTATKVDVVLTSGPSAAAVTYVCHNVQVHESRDNVVDVVSITRLIGDVTIRRAQINAYQRRCCLSFREVTVEVLLGYK
jgi:hypothetical protein